LHDRDLNGFDIFEQRERRKRRLDLVMYTLAKQGVEVAKVIATKRERAAPVAGDFDVDALP
jgi:hypothetical protein